MTLIKFTYKKWVNGSFDYDISLLTSGEITADDYNKMIIESYNILKIIAYKEFERLKLNCEKAITKAESIDREFNKVNFIKLELDYYNLMLRKKHPGGCEYFEFNDSKFDDFTKYPVEFINKIQMYYSRLLHGNIKLIIPNHKIVEFNPNDGSDYSAAILSIAWSMYVSFLTIIDVGSENKLSMKQIALIYSYKENNITKGKESKDIAKNYGFCAKNSGEKLYQTFNRYRKSTDRKGDEGSLMKNKNKKKLIESILPFLENSCYDKAIDEIKILDSFINN